MSQDASTEPTTVQAEHVRKLGRELEAFEKMLGELLQHHQGQFALIKDGRLRGTFTTEVEAYEEGIRTLGVDVFLVRQVLDSQPSASMPALFAGLLHAAP